MAPPDTATTTDESIIFRLELISQNALTEKESIILNAFAHGIQPATAEAAAEAAHQLDILCPPLDQEEEANDYLWMVWRIMITVARSPDVTDKIHIRLVSVLDMLRQSAKGNLDVYGSNHADLLTNLRLWRDLPQLALCMEAYFSDPMSNVVESGEFTPKAAQIWRNINSFAVRCLGAGVAGPYSDAMYAMRSALEEDLSTFPEMRMADCKILVACDWISHAAKPLLWWARENIGYTNITADDEEGQYVEGGTLYHGPAAMCLQRWAFWLGRFEEIGKEESKLNEETRKAALESVQFMEKIESSMATTFLEYRPGIKGWQRQAPEPPPQKMCQAI